jgi:hypothetical protein
METKEATSKSRRRKPSPAKRAAFKPQVDGEYVVWNLSDRSQYFPATKAKYLALIKRLTIDGAKLKLSHPK